MSRVLFWEQNVPGKALSLAVALVLDLILGEPPNRFHPVAWMGRFIGLGWRMRPRRGPLRQFAFGAALTLAGMAAFGLPWLLMAKPSASSWAWVWQGVALKPVFALRALLKAGEEVRRSLERGDLDEARRLVGYHLVSRDVSRLTESQVAAACIESLAENITDSLVAPLFYFVTGGLPAAWAYRFCNTADAMLGYRDPEREYLGKFAARLDDLLNWLPARLAALLIVAAAALAGESPSGAWRAMWSQHSRTASPNAGWTMAAMAGALGVVLEKPAHYRLEGGPVLPDAGDIRRAARVAALAAALAAAIYLVLGVM